MVSVNRQALRSEKVPLGTLRRIRSSSPVRSCIGSLQPDIGVRAPAARISIRRRSLPRAASPAQKSGRVCDLPRPSRRRAAKPVAGHPLAKPVAYTAPQVSPDPLRLVPCCALVERLRVGATILTFRHVAHRWLRHSPMQEIRGARIRAPGRARAGGLRVAHLQRRSGFLGTLARECVRPRSGRLL